MKNIKGSIRRRVSYQETDQMGVVHHANYVTWFEVARTEWMRSIGIAYSRMEQLGLMLPVRNLTLDYHKPAIYDQEVVIFTEIESFTAVRLNFSYEVRSLFSGDSDPMPGDLLVSGTSTHMWIDKNWKPARIDKVVPEAFRIISEHWSGVAEKSLLK